MCALPEEYSEFLRAAFPKVLTFSASLFRSDGGQPMIYSGSGTFVRWGEKCCLLTAAHVWEALRESDRVSLGIGRGEFVTIRRAYLACLHSSPRIGGKWGPWGPDLALIDLPEVDARALEARGKVFYNLSRRRSAALETPASDVAIWAVVGAPGEFVTVVGREPDLGLTHFTVGVTLISSLKAATKTHDGFDYVELPLTPKSMEGFPKEYGGISGAGLWRLGEADAAARTVTWTDAVSLEGVAFYHRRTAPEIVRCHGRRSIYRNLLDTVGT